jgi:hypothetical protein
VSGSETTNQHLAAGGVLARDRLFYVSITRAKRTLVISRALRVGRGPARQIGLTVTTGSKYWANLGMSPFLHDIMNMLPTAAQGASWSGCGGAAARMDSLHITGRFVGRVSTYIVIF